jgi:hypothetical protein
MSEDFSGAFEMKRMDGGCCGATGGLDISGPVTGFGQSDGGNLFLKIALVVIIVLVILVIMKVSDLSTGRICLSTRPADYWPSQLIDRSWGYGYGAAMTDGSTTPTSRRMNDDILLGVMDGR